MQNNGSQEITQYFLIPDNAVNLVDFKNKNCNCPEEIYIQELNKENIINFKMIIVINKTYGCKWKIKDNNIPYRINCIQIPGISNSHQNFFSGFTLKRETGYSLKIINFNKTGDFVKKKNIYLTKTKNINLWKPCPVN